MSSEERKKRPKLDRSEPLRSWSTLFEAPRADSAGVAPQPAEAPDLNDVISRSVRMGYQVVDDYLRQGARVARRLGGSTAGPQVLNDELQELGARSARHFADVTRLWFDAFRAATGGAGSAPDDAPPPAVTPATGAPTAEPARVCIEMRAHQPSQVTLDLQPEAARRELVVHALRAADETKPRISEVSFRRATADAPALLRVTIPARQPPGVYSGLLLDEQTNRPMGTLSVEVGAPEAAPRS